ncbi:MAG: hypothetical protein EP329_12940, partial [Deltaproteobacteria bacterium]
MRIAASLERAAFALLSTGALLSGCIDEGPIAGREGAVAIEVAPLSLDGVTDAAYTIRVTNAPNGGGEVVWERSALTSSQYGDGGGSLSFVGPCDAETGTNSVTLTLEALYQGVGDLMPADTYNNPGALTLDVVCVENVDVSVVFDITIARDAQQGFFDVAVSFDDIFCSAKLDCVDDAGGDLELLHNGDARDLTAVLGFACTPQVAGNATTYLYMNDPVIVCDGGAPFDTQSVTFDIGGQGNVDLATASNPAGYLFGAAVYRGNEALLSKSYWNISFGLNDATFALASTGQCVLTARATASATPLVASGDGFALPEGAVYPVIDWSVPLTNGTAGRVCTTHEVNGGDGVATTYLGYLPAANQFTWSNGPIYLRHQYSSATGLVVSADGSPCADAAECASGSCISGLCNSSPPYYGKDVFAHTGAAQQFVVPAGVSEIMVKAWGAGGGGGSASPGAAGGYAEATLSVSAGETLTIVVGGRGLAQQPSGPAVAGGYGGGGDSGPIYSGSLGGSGGGLSGVFSGGTAMTFDAAGQSRALLIAGGGTGGGSYYNKVGGNTGAGGGTDGLTGSLDSTDAGYSSYQPARVGYAGKQTYYANGCTSYCDASSNGTALHGGTGGGYGGAGGGGGYFGGGGSSAYFNGGGGSGYATPAATAPLLVAGTRQTPPSVTDGDYYVGVGVGGVGSGGYNVAGDVGGHGLVVITYCAHAVCVDPPAGASGSQAFAHTGAAQQFTVPADVTEVTVRAWGAGGGGGSATPGAAGGYAQATLSVTQGDVLTVVVGGRGIAQAVGDGAIPGGYGGGGYSGVPYTVEIGGSGGGLSGVFSGSAPLTFDATGQSRAIVIAGGGAGGSSRWNNAAGRNGGNTGAGGGSDGLYGSTADADTGYLLFVDRRGAPGGQTYYANGCTSYCDASAHGTALQGGHGGGYGGSGGGGGYF